MRFSLSRSFLVDPVKCENCELLILHDRNLLPFMTKFKIILEFMSTLVNYQIVVI